MDELAAQEFRRAVVEQDHSSLVVDCQAAVLQRREAMRVRRQGPLLDRSGGTAGPARKVRGSQASRAGIAEPAEQSQLEAKVDQPASVEAAEGGDEVVESVVEAHGGDCRMGPFRGNLLLS